MKYNPNLLEQLVQTLQGSCMSLDDGVQEVFGDEHDGSSLPMEYLNALDQELFLCATCGWWYEICDNADDGIDNENNCVDCYPDDHDEY